MKLLLGTAATLAIGIAGAKQIQTIKGYSLTVSNRTVEVEGICKVSEDSIECWKPDGTKDKAITEEFIKTCEGNPNNPPPQAQFRFNRKNRILMLKAVTKAAKPGDLPFSYGLVYADGGPQSETWTSNTIFSSYNASATGDHEQVEHIYLCGSFDKTTETHPLQYQFTQLNTGKSVIDFKKSTFEINGNKFEIMDILDNPSKPPTVTGGFGFNPQPNQKVTYLKIKPISLVDPSTIVQLSPANQKGEMYVTLDEKGHPLTAAEWQKRSQDQIRQGKVIGGPQFGPGFGRRPISMQSALDPTYMKPGTPVYIRFDLDRKAIHKLVLTSNHRTIYNFDPIYLDPK
ncbi:MAG: hypothetical protein JST12_09660 [Armatimonadetes bacterium]|nr:hypothetical protein [Armatimonadota bacterium]